MECRHGIPWHIGLYSDGLASLSRYALRTQIASRVLCSATRTGTGSRKLPSKIMEGNCIAGCCELGVGSGLSTPMMIRGKSGQKMSTYGETLSTTFSNGDCYTDNLAGQCLRLKPTYTRCRLPVLREIAQITGSLTKFLQIVSKLVHFLLEGSLV